MSDLALLVDQLHEASKARKAWADEEKRIKAEIMASLPTTLVEPGSSSVLTGTRSFATLTRVQSRKFDAKAFKEKEPDAYHLYTKLSESWRLVAGSDD